MNKIFYLTSIVLLLFSCSSFFEKDKEEFTESYSSLEIRKEGDNYLLYEYGKNNKLAECQNQNADEIFLKAIKSLDNKGTIYLAPGWYFIVNVIQLKSNMILEGRDTTAIIKRVTGGTVIAANNVKEVILKNLNIQSDFSKRTTGHGVFLGEGSSGVIIADCVIRKVNGSGIYIKGKESKDNLIQGNLICDCYGDAGIALMWGAGNTKILNNKVYRTKTHTIIVSAGGSNTVIKDNHVEQSGFYRPHSAERFRYFCHGIAIDGGPDPNQTGSHHLIENNTIINSGLAGIEVADSQNDVVIENNYIDGTGKAALNDSGCQYGIAFGGGFKPSRNAVISGNTIKNTKEEGIFIGENNPKIARTGEVKISNNHISFSASYGIRINSADQISIEKNQIEDTRFSLLQVQGIESQYAQKIKVADNHFVLSREGYGIYLKYAEEITLTNNNVESTKLKPYHAEPNVKDVVFN